MSDQFADFNQSPTYPPLSGCLAAKDVGEVYEALAHLSDDYPDFENWYWNKVVPGYFSGDRSILVYRQGQCLTGVAILKRNFSERKICTVWVAPEFENRGVGFRLFKASFAALACKYPLASVSDARLPKFQKIFDFFGFELTQKLVGVYRPNSTEYVFNGFLQPSYRH